MARYLALDWDRTSFHILSADVSKQGVEIGACADWRLEEDLTPGSAESLGKKLREFLKTQNIAPGPVLVSLGRDRVVLKEISYPAVSANEEPALVRFQATKDLADAAEDVVLDYTPLPNGSGSQERRALAVILRRDIQAGLQQLCKAAGLKMLALVPRPFIMAGCLERAGIPEGNKNSVAVVLAGERWGELTIVQGSTLLFSRSLTGGSSLPTEVRRGLTVFANQPGAKSQPSPRALFLLGCNGSSTSFRETLGLPVEELEVLSGNEEARTGGGQRGSVAACLGLLQAWSKKQVPINLARPKEPVAVVDQGKRRKLQILAAAAGALLLAFIAGQLVLSGQKAQLKALNEEKEEIEVKFKRFEQDKVDLYAIKDWEKGAIPWIDELYDLAARFPQETGFKITKVEIMPLRNKDRLQARMTLQGVAPPGREHLVLKFIESMRDPHLVARVERFQTDAGNYKIQVDIAYQGPSAYQSRLVLPYGMGGGPPPAKKSLDSGKKKPLSFPFGDDSPSKTKDPPPKKDFPPKKKADDGKESAFPFDFPLEGMDGLEIIPDAGKGKPPILRLPPGGEP
jgi:hypothetical protein